jgi:hypothetical protein
VYLFFKRVWEFIKQGMEKKKVYVSILFTFYWNECSSNYLGGMLRREWNEMAIPLCPFHYFLLNSQTREYTE